MSDTDDVPYNPGDFAFLLSDHERMRTGRDAEIGAVFPRADAVDLLAGAGYIPLNVSQARRNGQIVRFVQLGSPGDWYWELPDGRRISHYV